MLVVLVGDQPFEFMTNYTDIQLKQALVKLYPDEVFFTKSFRLGTEMCTSETAQFCWKFSWRPIYDNQLLYICNEIAKQLTPAKARDYVSTLSEVARTLAPGETRSALLTNFVVAEASWQQRTIALAKTKGIEIV